MLPYFFKKIRHEKNIALIFSDGDSIRGTSTTLYGCDTLAVCRACECTISEMVEFLDSDREHMQQGIFDDSESDFRYEPQVSWLHSTLKLDLVSYTL